MCAASSQELASPHHYVLDIYDRSDLTTYQKIGRVKSKTASPLTVDPQDDNYPFYCFPFFTYDNFKCAEVQCPVNDGAVLNGKVRLKPEQRYRLRIEPVTLVSI